MPTATSTSGGTATSVDTNDAESAPPEPPPTTIDPAPDMPPVGNEPCEKVDLLFMIDSSGSMRSKQENLINSFPIFADELQAELADVDSYHIGIVTTDEYDANEPEACRTMGALITTTGGADSSESTCGPFAAGERYMTEADDLAEAFACTAQIGTSGGGNERQAEGILTALDPERDDDCNDGFLRDDALLVVVMITDEEDGGPHSSTPGSPGDPPDWYDTLVEAKGGIETNIVVLSILGLETSLCAPQVPGDWEESIGLRLAEFTESFTYGSIADICEPTYDGFLADAVEFVDVACLNYTHVG